jgi:hypothetical protein
MITLAQFHAALASPQAIKLPRRAKMGAARPAVFNTSELDMGESMDSAEMLSGLLAFGHFGKKR